MDRFQTSNVSISNGSREEFWQQSYCKNWFSDRVFYIIIADANIGSLKTLHTLFNEYLDYMLVKFEQYRVVRTIHNFELFDKNWLTISENVLTSFWKTFLWLK